MHLKTIRNNSRPAAGTVAGIPVRDGKREGGTAKRMLGVGPGNKTLSFLKNMV